MKIKFKRCAFAAIMVILAAAVFSACDAEQAENAPADETVIETAYVKDVLSA